MHLTKRYYFSWSSIISKYFPIEWFPRLFYFLSTSNLNYNSTNKADESRTSIPSDRPYYSRLHLLKRYTVSRPLISKDVRVAILLLTICRGSSLPQICESRSCNGISIPYARMRGLEVELKQGLMIDISRSWCFVQQLACYTCRDLIEVKTLFMEFCFVKLFAFGEVHMSRNLFLSCELKKKKKKRIEENRDWIKLKIVQEEFRVEIYRIFLFFFHFEE